MKNSIKFLFFLTTCAFIFSSCANSEQGGPMGKKNGKAVKAAQKAAVLKIGDTAPDFKLKNIDGTMMSLSDMADAKGYIVTFTCNHCPYAIMYEDRLVELNTKMSKLGYPLVAINPNDPEVKPEDSYEGMQVRAKEKGFNFPYLMDEGQKVYPQYGATKTPHVFILDKDRKVTYIGAIDDNARDASAVEERYVENAIAAMEKGQAPDPNFTKAIGCSIKTKS